MTYLRSYSLVACSALVLVVSRCVTPSNGYSLSSTSVLSGVPITTEARYECSFLNLWTEARHPRSYPSYPDEPSWGIPLLMVHSEKFIPWQVGKKASAGMATFAKTGVPFDMTVEFLSSGDAAKDMEVGVKWPADDSMETQKFGEWKATATTPYLTTLSFMSPSPDWFTGFSMLDLRQGTSDPSVPQMWYRSFTVDSNLFTAGLMSGNSYTVWGEPYNPSKPINRFEVSGATPGTIAAPSVLLDASGTAVNFFAQWTCNLINAVPVEQLGQTTTPPNTATTSTTTSTTNAPGQTTPPANIPTPGTTPPNTATTTTTNNANLTIADEFDNVDLSTVESMEPSEMSSSTMEPSLHASYASTVDFVDTGADAVATSRGTPSLRRNDYGS